MWRTVEIKKSLEKIVQGFVLGVLLFAVPSFNSNMILANAGKPEKVRAKETITRFLSSVKLLKNAYDFDHNGDGVIDMRVYPLKTENPDLKTKYITLQEAINKKHLILKENPNLSNIREDPPGSFSIFAQYLGSRPLYYPRGSQIGGGWQNRGFGRGGILGGDRYGGFREGRYYDGYGPGRGRYDRGTRRYHYRGFSEKGVEDTDLGAFSFEDNFQSPQHIDGSAPADNPGFEVDALCFEKWRLIEESRRLGDPEYFSYAGMASPFVRKQLLLFPNQTNAHIAIEKELRKLGVHSKTKALADVFKNRDIKKIIDYYIANSKDVLGKNKGISGMIVTNKNKILCADVYSSPDLFEKMFPQLMQSAALGVCRVRGKGRKHLGRSDVEKLLFDIKQVQKLKKESSQTYKLCYPTLVSEAVLYSDESGTKLVHIEAYPRP